MRIKISAEKGADAYKKTVEAAKKFCEMEGNWAAVIKVYQRDDARRITWTPEKLNLTLLSDTMENCDQIDWGPGAEVTVEIEYDVGGFARQEAYCFLTRFATADGPDDVKALELLIVILNAWAEEDIFPNAVLAVDTRNLLWRTDIQDYLKEHGFNGYIVSKTERPELKQ